MLPFPARQILPSVQILISSVTKQNPPDLLPPRSACSLPICPSCRCHSQPLPGVSRKQRYNTLDFPAENRVPTGVLLAPIGNPEPKGLCPSGHPTCPCSGYPSFGYAPTRTGKTGTEIYPNSGQISVPVLLSSGRESEQKALPSDKLEQQIFAPRCENLLF